jgi:hypothetical protein
MKRLAIALLVVLCGCTSNPSREPRETLPTPPPAGEPGDLIGLTSVQLQGLLGKASFARRENGSELWRYDNSQCHAFFFLYSEAGSMRVRHVETVPHGPTMAADPSCLAVLRGKPASPVS